MFKKIILTMLLAAFASVGVVKAGGVTNIKEVVNRSSKIVKLSTYENKNRVEVGLKTTGEIVAGATWTGDVWIPWANNKDEFLRHRITLEINIPDGNQAGAYGLTTFFIWQSGDFVRFTKMKSSMRESYVDNAPKVPGVAKVDGERRLVVGEENRKVVFKFEEYKKIRRLNL